MKNVDPPKPVIVWPAADPNPTQNQPEPEPEPEPMTAQQADKIRQKLKPATQTHRQVRSNVT